MDMPVYMYMCLPYIYMIILVGKQGRVHGLYNPTGYHSLQSLGESCLWGCDCTVSMGITAALGKTV